MTREEAISVLHKIKPTPRRADGKSLTHIVEVIALDLAIEALEQKPCEDAISRTEAKELAWDLKLETCYDNKKVIEMLERRQEEMALLTKILRIM